MYLLFCSGQVVSMYYHDDPVYGLHVHPENSNVFLTASDDGKVLLWDIRTSCLNGMLILSFIIDLFSKKRFHFSASLIGLDPPPIFS